MRLNLNRINLIKAVHEKFGVKVFIAFALFIFFISFSFTVFYIRHQSKSIRDTLIRDGKLLTAILAYNSRIAVFSENGALLKNQVEAVFQDERVLEVSIFNMQGELLKRQERAGTRRPKGPASTGPGIKSEISAKVTSSKSAFYREGKHSFEFQSPVHSDPGYSIDDSVLFEENSTRKADRIIGFVTVKLGKQELSRQMENLLFKSILIGIIFLIIGSGVSFLVANGITKPLNRLTQEVNFLGRGNNVRGVTVETDDEIGKLAKAFNNMYDSLKRRETALKASEKSLHSLSSQLLNAQEQERKRVAKELHDELGQDLALLKHRVRSIQNKSSEDQSPIRRECESISRSIDLTIENVRRLSRDLMPVTLEHLGLSAALSWLTNNFKKQYAIRTSIDAANIDLLFSPEAQTNIYRIFQEALTNVGKHARAGYVRFAVKKGPEVVSFQLKDDGQGFDVNGAMAGNLAERGMGLTAMKERAHMLGARLDIASRPGTGTAVTLTVSSAKDE